MPLIPASFGQTAWTNGFDNPIFFVSHNAIHNSKADIHALNPGTIPTMR